jgi:hypothetical protein
MKGSPELADALAAVSRAFLWSFLIGFVFLLVWFVAFLAIGDVGYEIQAKFINLPKHELALLDVAAMAYVKLNVFVFFLIPGVALQLVARGIRKSAAG